MADTKLSDFPDAGPLTGSEKIPVIQGGNKNTTPAAIATYIGAGTGAPIDSPLFTGNPRAPTPTPGDNDSSLATTAFVTAAVAAVVGGSAPTGTAGGDLAGTFPNPTIKGSVALSGNPTGPTQSPGNNTTRLATTAFVTAADAAAVTSAVAQAAASATSIYAPKASPALTGNPTAPTQTSDNNSTRIATTAFVAAAVAAAGGGGVAGGPIMWGANGHPMHGGSPYVPATTSLATQVGMVAALGLRQYRCDYDSDDSDHFDSLTALLAAAAVSGVVTILPCLNPDPLSGSYDSESLAYAFGHAQALNYATTFPSVAVWEIGNEWEGRVGFTGQGSFIGNYDATKYAKVRGLVRGMFDGIRAGNPSAKVAFGSAGGGGWGMMDGLWADGLRWDYTVEHFYSDGGTVDIRHLFLVVGETDKLALLRDHYGVPIWMTEFNYWNTADSPPSKSTMASYLSTTMAQYDGFAATYGLQVVDIYELMDEPALSGREAGFGLYTSGVVNAAGTAVQTYLASHPSRTSTSGGLGGGGGSFTWPPTAPDFATTIIADAAAGRFTDWVYGDVETIAAITVTLPSNVSDIGIDMHGARLSWTGGSAPTTDMLTYICPDSNADNTNISRLNFRNMNFNGNNNCRNGLVLSCKKGASGIFGGNLINVRWGYFLNAGCLMYGDVFEYDLVACYASDCIYGVEMRNPTAGGGNGVISSIKFFGGDYRSCGNGPSGAGIAATAETTYQEPAGFHVIAVDFIGNNAPGILASSGCALVFGSHLEANCRGSSPPTHGAVWCYGGAVNMINCDGADNGNTQRYLLDIASPGLGAVSTAINCSMTNEGTGNLAKVAKLSAAGTLVVDFSSGGSSGLLDGSGTWHLQTPNYTQTIV